MSGKVVKIKSGKVVKIKRRVKYRVLLPMLPDHYVRRVLDSELEYRVRGWARGGKRVSGK